MTDIEFRSGQGIQVTLEKGEMHDGIAEAVHQLRVSDERDLNHRVSYDGDILERVHREIVGVLGERACCHAYGKQWKHRVNEFHRNGDIGKHVEVRATHHHNGHLIVRESDRPYLDRWYFLVTGTAPVLTIRGAARGSFVFTHGRFSRGDDGQDQWWLPWRSLPYPAKPRQAVSS